MSARPTGRPQDCRCARCVYAADRTTAWPPPASLPPCPWDGHLTEGELFPALYLPTWDERGLLCQRTEPGGRR